MKKLKEQCEMIYELLDACNEKLTSEPSNIEIIQLRGILYSGVELYDEAIKDLDKVINSLPDDEDAYFLRCDCHYNKGEYDLANQDYLRALKIQFPDDEEFVKGYTEEVISKSTIDNNKELKDLKKTLEYEKKRILISYIPQLSD